MRTLNIKVAGVTYEGRQEILQRMHGKELCRIEPEPTNAYDPNALAVKVALKDGTIAHVGYVPKEVAKEIAPLLEGENLMVTIADITGGFLLESGDTAALGLRLRVEVPTPEETENS